MKLLAALLILALVAFLTRSLLFSFRAQAPYDYATTGPTFSLRDHLSGPIHSEGVIHGPDGRMASRFVAQMHGTWDGDTGTLTEAFTYSNGRKQTREWRLQIGPGDSFTATADDIVGTARGTLSGATAMLKYRIVLPEEAGGHTLDVTDWMYLTANGTIMNRSEMRKFGIKVAELVATLRPAPDAAVDALAAE